MKTNLFENTNRNLTTIISSNARFSKRKFTMNLWIMHCAHCASIVRPEWFHVGTILECYKNVWLAQIPFCRRICSTNINPMQIGYKFPHIVLKGQNPNHSGTLRVQLPYICSTNINSMQIGCNSRKGPNRHISRTFWMQIFRTLRLLG